VRLKSVGGGFFLLPTTFVFRDLPPDGFHFASQSVALDSPLGLAVDLLVPF